MSEKKKSLTKSIFIAVFLKIIKIFSVFVTILISPLIYLYIVGPISSDSLNNYAFKWLEAHSKKGINISMEKVLLYCDLENFGLGINIINPSIVVLSNSSDCKKIYTKSIKITLRLIDIIKGDLYSSFKFLTLNEPLQFSMLEYCDASLEEDKLDEDIGIDPDELKNIIYSIGELKLKLEVSDQLEPLVLEAIVDKEKDVYGMIFISIDVVSFQPITRAEMCISLETGRLVCDTVIKNINFYSLFKYLDPDYQNKDFDLNADISIKSDLVSPSKGASISLLNLNGFIQGRSMRAPITSDELEISISREFDEFFIKGGKIFVNKKEFLVDFSIDKSLNYQVRPLTKFLTVQEIVEYWPSGVELEAQDWIREHIKSGKISDIMIEKKLDQDIMIEFKLLDSRISSILDSKIPPIFITNADLLLKGGVLYAKSSNATILRSKIKNCSLTLDLNNKVEALKINASIEGSVSEVVGIAKKFAPYIPINENHINGVSETYLDIKLDSEWEEDIEIKSSFQDLSIKNVVGNIHLNRWNGFLLLKNKKVTIEGVASINGSLPVSIKFEKDIENTASQAKLAINIMEANSKNWQKAGIAIPKYISGPISSNINCIFYKNYLNLSAEFNLFKSSVVLPYLKFEKHHNKRGYVSLNLRKEYRSNKMELGSYKVDMDEFLSVGDGSISDDLEQISIKSNFNFIKGSNFNFNYTENKESVNLDINGASLNVSLDSFLQEKTTNQKIFKLNCNLKNLSFDNHHSMVLSKINIDYRNGKLNEMLINSALSTGGSIMVFYDFPVLSITSDNAGSVLQLLGIGSDMNGGKLEIKGFFNEDNNIKNGDAKFMGHASIYVYSLKVNPTLAQILSTLSISSKNPEFRFQAKNKKMVLFDTFHTDIELDSYNILSFNKILAEGQLLNVEGAGFIDIDTEFVDIQCRIVPVDNIVNYIIGKAPIIGNLLSGNTRGDLIYSKLKIYGEKGSKKVDVTHVPGVIGRIMGMQNEIESEIMRSKIKLMKKKRAGS
ncbi:DUF3971 domain protein [Candidatus Cyrtobacter comes]|uniref:DUF3971 domain protein n=1 Tax=Candidatus Cyrtobacter comes TaxID=675776 RepID=A0ABU5L7A9_9RICK|nr:DUF3971 domain-containing protein [Candidatus Cyrtobacter comes]MDZ5761932.1 DUF3971 domain protein [Candidatus Cyrtobacter comes]